MNTKSESTFANRAAAEKGCGKCRVVKPLSGFHRNRRNRDGRETNCRECRASIAAARSASPRPVGQPSLLANLIELLLLVAGGSR